ncbi:hypothetical protein Dimus_037748, partial [Dionaea muscipula]
EEEEEEEEEERNKDHLDGKAVIDEATIEGESGSDDQFYDAQVEVEPVARGLAGGWVQPWLESSRGLGSSRGSGFEPVARVLAGALVRPVARGLAGGSGRAGALSRAGGWGLAGGSGPKPVAQGLAGGTGVRAGGSINDPRWRFGNTRNSHPINRVSLKLE